MAVDKLVDSGVLDAALEDIADVIRNKTGISGTFDFPSPNDLADAIDFYLLMPTGTKSITENGTNIDVAQYSKVDVNVSGGGGGNVDSGTVVFSANTTTFSVNLDFEPTAFVFGCSVADVGTATSWKTFFGVYYDDPNIVTAGIKYGTNAPSGQFYAKSKFSYANGQASITLNYPCPAGITYYWMACA